MKRREFLGRVAAGSAVLSMPAFVSGCGVMQTMDMTSAVPANPFLDWFAIDEAVISRVMATLTAKGADSADLYFQHTRSNQLEMEDGIVSRAHSTISQGVGLRIVVGDQTGYAFTEELTLSSMLAAARTAASIAHGAEAMPPQSFTSKKMGGLYTIQHPWSEIGIEKKLPLLQYVDRAARAADKAVNQVSIHWSDVDERVMIARLDGHLITDHRPMTRLSVQATASRGNDTQTGFANIAAREEFSWYTNERLDKLAGEAVDRTLILFDARRPPVGEMPVVLAAGACGILLHEAIGHGMEADFNHKGTSIYSDMIGEKVAEPFVNIIDQGTIPHERGALNYDDEGNACGRTAMVENGILRSYLHDEISARQYSVQTTGSGRRQSYKFAPMPRMTCTFMENGPNTPEEIVAAVDFGIVVETITNGQVQIGAGDYVFSVRNGWLIEKGKVTMPIRDLTIAGNGPETLKHISMAANDTRMDNGGWTCGKNGQSVPVSQGLPTVLVPGLGVSGANT